MRVSSIASGLAALISLTSANPIKRSTGEVVVYWGYGNETSLSSYCAPGQGIDILIMAFLSNFGDGHYPNGGFGPNCSISKTGAFTSGCASLAQDIQTCQDAGVKVFASIGGGGAKWAIDGSSDAAKIASALWNSYGGNLTVQAPRPFGDVKIDGWDFDIESNPHNQSQSYLGDVVNGLRGYFRQDRSKTYYISGAPQCPLPEENMGPGMMEAAFDYLWIQFYNNPCSAANLIKNPKQNPDGHGEYNLDAWPRYLSKGKSAHANLFVGLPASIHGAAEWDYIPPQNLTTVLQASPGIGGVMLWNAAQSDKIDYNGCNYAQTLSSLFSTGAVCSGSNSGSGWQ